MEHRPKTISPLDALWAQVQVSFDRSRSVRAWCVKLGVVCGLVCGFDAALAEPQRAHQQHPVPRQVQAHRVQVGKDTGLRRREPSSHGKRALKRASMRGAAAAPMPPTHGDLLGLHTQQDALALNTGSALMMDADTRAVVYAKNSDALLPIASITKLMTALVVLDSHADMNEMITVTDDDIDTEKHSRSRLPVGSRLAREDMLHLALMSSENRAAHALARHHPGGLVAFVGAMNARAASMGMMSTRYQEPTGLSPGNQSTAGDLALLMQEAVANPEIRRWTTSKDHDLAVRGRMTTYRNSNELVRSGAWEILAQKTGYISEAGRCVVMEFMTGGRKWIMVLLDASGSRQRWRDADKLKTYAMSVSHASSINPALK